MQQPVLPRGGGKDQGLGVSTQPACLFTPAAEEAPVANPVRGRHRAAEEGGLREQWYFPIWTSRDPKLSRKLIDKVWRAGDYLRAGARNISGVIADWLDRPPLSRVPTKMLRSNLAQARRHPGKVSRIAFYGIPGAPWESVFTFEEVRAELRGRSR